MTEQRRYEGRYRVDGSLGRGGMSEVFHGYDERLDRRIAIKVLRPPTTLPTSADSPEAAEILDAYERDRKRFVREIRTTAQLEHPGIPAVYDTGVETLPDGRTEVWVAMQLLRGSTLESILDHEYDAALPSIEWAAAVAAQIAAVLADVHRIDIVHRDIKPANVIIEHGGLVKVLDFGIAILRGAGALPRLTQVDRTVGTPPYMSPEQCLGLAVTSASDIYSLGCVLFELLIGDVPFVASPNVSLRAHHLQSPPPAASSRRNGIPADIGDLVTAMLAKGDRDRPSAETVYETLLPYTTHRSGVPDERDPTRPFRRPLLAAAHRRATQDERGAISQPELENLRANVQVLLDNDRPTEAVNLIESGMGRPGNDPVIELQLRHLLAAALFYAGEYNRAAPLFDVVGRDYGKYVSPTEQLVLDCAYHAGHAYAEVGKPDKALPQLRFFVQNATEDGGDESAKIRESRFVIAQMLALADNTDDAVAELGAIRSQLVETFGEDSTQVRNLDKQIRRLGK
ncbi:serine/threonine-protein kinase [Mycobacteroides abscessus]|uniref:serine/threonine-protein kinase n=1 Tax=Mycobacteroides abscessus TaxID=36809 RepID=UPI00092A81AA|nr:serine/threonine-protein kinase [Mycobacteroides abscessus]SHT77706.1 serine/threonine-protein kinase [Mycobacteroides abscessus subsp. bolletii]SHX07351.1 serine/threonine-protein kinase [Mycobacteroides abscessus subsp. bolletii]SHX23772.1 serine/threonine-protein kinase [Mycobacteroides abscessus subsp. bolletii]SHX24024.1 serine/threonine-protein kinase [Mycobacteroides abscessus subsp. bolletii]SKS07745.1 serine/threonine-protein kinase [Mycobacteroides abscessus subsp. bolletii]